MMNSEKANGVMDKVVGRAQELAGDVTGDERLQAEGAGRYAAGALQEKYGDALTCINDTVKKNPIATVAIIAGVSLLAGLLLRRR
ncbi:CsbD family protein [Serratia entomophila]|uniref:CsbD family protein n=2 Tax=Serratia entomophila TaxID=42906 RepID=UPI0021BB3F86|nr:CsbD family protein [Serratia entomophila]